MPDIRLVKGTAALSKVLRQAGTLGDVTRLIRGADPLGAVTSCALTAGILGDIISDKATVVPPGFTMKSLSQKIDVVAGLLDSPKMVYLGISPDHHFVMFPIDVDKAVILQGFQGVYTLTDWLENRGNGVIRKDELVAALQDLVSGVELRKRAGAVKLFSYSLADEGKVVVSPAAQAVEGEIHDYFDDKAITITAGGYKDL